MRNSIEDSLILLLDLEKMESRNPGFVDEDLLDCVQNGFDIENGGFWDNQLPSFRKEVYREDEEEVGFYEVSNLTVRDKSTWGFMGS